MLLDAVSSFPEASFLARGGPGMELSCASCLSLAGVVPSLSYFLAGSGRSSEQTFLLDLQQVPFLHLCSRCLGLVLPSLALLQTHPSLGSSSSASGRCRPGAQCRAHPVWGAGLGKWGSRLLLLFI